MTIFYVVHKVLSLPSTKLHTAPLQSSQSGNGDISFQFGENALSLNAPAALKTSIRTLSPFHLNFILLNCLSSIVVVTLIAYHTQHCSIPQSLNYIK